MTRLSEEELGIIQRIGERDKYQRYELVRGYRRAAELEGMLRQWVEAAHLAHDACDSSCPTLARVARTEALLVEGDE